MKLFQKYGLLVFIGLLFLPTAINVAHILSGHQHNICTHYSENHFHQQNNECEFFHFQQPTFPEIEIAEFRIFQPEENINISVFFYEFLSEYEYFSFYLRGPPATV